MIGPTKHNVLLAILCLAMTGLNSAATVGQEWVSKADWGRGYNGLAMISRSVGLDPVPPGQWNEIDPDRTVIVVLGAVSGLPIDPGLFLQRGGSVLVACDRTEPAVLRRCGIRFFENGFVAGRRGDGFQGWRDCPVVSNLDHDHPVTAGLNELITNRPAILTFAAGRRSQRLQILARFPTLRDIGPDRPLMVAGEDESGGRLLALSDPSLLTNQMLLYGDNARLAWQALTWLRAAERDQLLLFVDGTVTQPAGLDQTQIQLPPPTRQEVLEALKNLPPDQLIEFGNTVATVVEDEGMVNEFLATISREIPPVVFQRFLLLLGTFGLGFWLWFGYFSRDTLVEGLDPEGTGDGQVLTRRQHRRLAGRQRARAARFLLNQFLFRVTGHGLGLADPGRIRQLPASDVNGSNPLMQIRRRIRQIDRKNPGWWTTRRLLRLERDVQSWNQLHENGVLVYDASLPPDSSPRQP